MVTRAFVFVLFIVMFLCLFHRAPKLVKEPQPRTAIELQLAKSNHPVLLQPASYLFQPATSLFLSKALIPVPQKQEQIRRNQQILHTIQACESTACSIRPLVFPGHTFHQPLSPGHGNEDPLINS